MSERVEKWGSLLRAAENAEFKAARRVKEVRDVVQQREQVLVQLQNEKNELREQLRFLQNQLQNGHVIAGDVQAITASAKQAQQLREDIKIIDKKVRVQASEVEKAVERLEMEERELLEVRIEKKKMESLRDNQRQGQVLLQQASEELAAEERNHPQVKK